MAELRRVVVVRRGVSVLSSSERSGVNGAPMVTLVAGPPGSGKTSYVHEHAHPADLVVDFDEIFAAVSGLPMFNQPPALRGEVHHRFWSALKHQLPTARVTWITRCAPERADRERFRRRYGVVVVVLAVPFEECRRRITLDKRRPSEARALAIEGARRWWSSYEQDGRDIVLDPADWSSNRTIPPGGWGADRPVSPQVDTWSPKR